MSTETLKISLVQKILTITDPKLLNKVKSLIEKENVIGYDTNGFPITESTYIKEMDILLSEIDSGRAETFTTDEVKKYIIDANHLAQ